jgi:glycosyltransferase involved in cell wall biosynthesis
MRIAILMSLGVSWSREAALRLAELGHKVHAIDFQSEVKGNYLRGREDITSGSVARLRDKLAGIHIIPGDDVSQFRYLRYAPRLRKICKEIDADILLSLWGGGFSMISYASGIRPYAVFVGGGDILRVSGLQQVLSRHALHRAVVTLANGKYLGERTKAFAPKALVRSFYLGVDTDIFVPGSPQDLPVTIICTRGFLPVYNNGYLIEALALLPDSLPEFRVVFTSAGETVNETIALADRVLKPAVRRRVQFLNGVTDQQMRENLQSAHIYTSMARYDGTSISLLEAMSCGLFPILSDIPQNREWIEPQSRNGMLVPFDQPVSYAKALERSILDAAWRKEAAPINRKLILDRADGRNNMAFVASVLEEAVGSRNRN